jgi:hypothetical protein
MTRPSNSQPREAALLCADAWGMDWQTAATDA